MRAKFHPHQCLSATQERNPEALLKPFMTTLAAKGLAFQQALFVPPESSYRKLGGQEQHKDLSWQHGLQKVYQSHLTTSPNGVCYPFGPPAFGAQAHMGQWCIMRLNAAMIDGIE